MIKIHNFYVITCEIEPYNFLNFTELHLKVNDVLMIMEEINESTYLYTIKCLYKGKIIQIVSSWLDYNAVIL